MKRFLLSLGVGMILQVIVVVFWIVSSRWKLPAIWDYIVAPGMFPTSLYIDGGPPASVMAVCFIINIGIYSLLSYGALSLIARLKARSDAPTSA